MILGIGCDIVEVARMEKAMVRHGEQFEEKCFTAYECQKAKARGDVVRPSYYAKRFAAKEAYAKALGTGFSGEFTLKDVGVEEDAAGRPYIVLSAIAQKALEARVPAGEKASIHLSLSDEKGHAIAFVVIESRI